MIGGRILGSNILKGGDVDMRFSLVQCQRFKGRNLNGALSAKTSAATARSALALLITDIRIFGNHHRGVPHPV